jgi:hypothetical protein
MSGHLHKMKKLPNNVSEIYSDINENEIVSYSLKGITPADSGKYFFLEKVDGIGSNYRIISSSRILLNDPNQNLLISIDLKESDNGFEFHCANAKYDVKILEDLLSQYNFNKVNITNEPSGQSLTGPLYIVEVESGRHIGDQNEFKKLGYKLLFRL